MILGGPSARVGRRAHGKLFHLLDESDAPLCDRHRPGRPSGEMVVTAARDDFELHAPARICGVCRDTEDLLLMGAVLDALHNLIASHAPPIPVKPGPGWHVILVRQRAAVGEPFHLVCELTVTSLPAARDAATNVIQELRAEQEGAFNPEPPAAGAWGEMLAAARTATSGCVLKLPDDTRLHILTRRQALERRSRQRDSVPCPECGGSMTPTASLCSACRTDQRVDRVLELWRLRVQEGLTNMQIAARVGRSKHSVAGELSRLRAIGFNVPGSPGQGSGPIAGPGMRSAPEDTKPLAAALRARGITP